MPGVRIQLTAGLGGNPVAFACPAWAQYHSHCFFLDVPNQADRLPAGRGKMRLAGRHRRKLLKWSIEDQGFLWPRQPEAYAVWVPRRAEQSQASWSGPLENSGLRGRSWEISPAAAAVGPWARCHPFNAFWSLWGKRPPLWPAYLPRNERPGSELRHQQPLVEPEPIPAELAGAA